jgi:hypothetical protein
VRPKLLLGQLARRKRKKAVVFVALAAVVVSFCLMRA